MNCLPFFKASVTWWIISSFAVVQKTKACLSGSEFETGSVSFMWVAACFMGILSNLLYRVYELVGHQSKVDVWDS